MRDALMLVHGRTTGAEPDEGDGRSDDEAPIEGRQKPANCGSDHADEAPSGRSILEALLFVGNDENRPLSVREAATIIGGVTPDEVQQYADELNASYAEEGTAYHIVHEAGGLRLVLREELERVRRRFYSRVREARLSQAAVEVLAIVAYRQPIRGEEVEALRGMKSGAVLAQLVRRRLVAIERPADMPRRPFYRTTDRFLRLYGLASLEDLPQVASQDGEEKQRGGGGTRPETARDEGAEGTGSGG